MKDEAEAVLGLIPQLDESFDTAVDLMYHCKGKVIVTGVGKSGRDDSGGCGTGHQQLRTD